MWQGDGDNRRRSHMWSVQKVVSHLLKKLRFYRGTKTNVETVFIYLVTGI